MSDTGVHHVDLVVSSIERSLPFYRELLEPLGTRVGEVPGERGETIRYLGGAVAARSDCARHRPQARTTATGSASTTSQSGPRESRSRSATAGRSSTAPRSRARPREHGYMPGFYAFFFYDPDGIKLEVVHVPPRAE